MRLARRWLTHRSRIPRGLRAAVAIIMGAFALMGIAAGTGGAASRSSGSSAGRHVPASATPVPTPTTLPPPRGPDKPPFGPGPGNPTKSFPSSPTLKAEGYNLYEESCSSCHGIAMQGVVGRAPSLRGVGPGPVDFYLSTGRMPLANPYQAIVDHGTPVFNRHQIDAIIAYISSFGGPPAPTADPAKGNLETGYDVFVDNCAGCHQIVGRGGMFVGSWAPNLLKDTPQELAEAVRMGPYLMPRFDYHEISQHQLDSLAKYVLYTQHPENLGGWSIYNIGPIPEGMVAWFLGLGSLLIVARLIGERNDERWPIPPAVHDAREADRRGG
jgi:ubiquinol-cytochrome c reductase cytochrome c subunit